MATLGELAEAKYEPLISDELMGRMKPRIVVLAEKLKQARGKGRFVLLRFHGDADGICGALALSGVLKCYTYQQNAAVYSVKDAVRDLGNMAGEENPLVIFVDFGMNADGEEGLRLLKAAGVELIIIDHHPPSGKAAEIADFCLTPWEFAGVGSGADVSHYVAGYLCAEVARAAGVEAGEYARIACAGDKSVLLADIVATVKNAASIANHAGLSTGRNCCKTSMVCYGEGACRKALVLDYLAVHSAHGNGLKFYKSVMEKEELLASIYAQAMEKIEDARDALMKAMKERVISGFHICLLDLDKVLQKGEFPNRSKATTAVFEKVMGNGAVVVFGIGEKTIIIRLNNAAARKGLSADALAKRVSGSMADFVDAGGGHAKAGAIQVKEGFANSVIEEILKEIAALAPRN